MSKKTSGKDNKSNPHLPIGLQLLNELSPLLKDIGKLIDLTDRKNSLAIGIDKIFYRYQQPDYSAKATKEIGWLGPLYNAEHIDNKVSLCGYIKDDSEGMSLEEQRKQLREYVYTLLTDEQHQYDHIDWSLLGAFWMMEQLKLDDCLDVVLETLRQKSHFFFVYFIGHEEAMSALLYQLGKNHSDQLTQMLYEDGLIPQIKPILFDALVWIALKEPQKRLAVVTDIIKYLNHCYDICSKGAAPTNISHYAHSVASAHIHEAMPIIEKLLHDINIMLTQNDILEGEIKMIMNDDSVPFNNEHSSLNEYLMDLYAEPGADPYRDKPYGHFFTDEEMKELDEEAEKKRKEEEEDDDWGFDIWDDDEDNDEDDWDDEEDDEDWDDDDEPGDAARYDDDYECYQMKITLKDAPDPVERVIEVPSHLYLAAFIELILIAFNRKDIDIPPYHFAKDGEYYADCYFPDVDVDDDHDTNLVTIHDLMQKVGDHLKFVIEGGTYTNPYYWEHDIELVEAHKYKTSGTYLTDVVSMQGIYPTKACKNMKEYKKKLKASKMRKLNKMTVSDNMHNWEDDNMK